MLVSHLIAYICYVALVMCYVGEHIVTSSPITRQHVFFVHNHTPPAKHIIQVQIRITPETQVPEYTGKLNMEIEHFMSQ